MALPRIFPKDDKGFHCFLLIRSRSPLLLHATFFIVKLYRQARNIPQCGTELKSDLCQIRLSLKFYLNAHNQQKQQLRGTELSSGFLQIFPGVVMTLPTQWILSVANSTNRLIRGAHLSTSQCQNKLRVGGIQALVSCTREASREDSRHGTPRGEVKKADNMVLLTSRERPWGSLWSV